MKPFFVLLILLFVVFVLLCLPVVFKVSYKEDLLVRLRYLFITKTLYPAKEKPKKDKKRKSENDNTKEPKKEKKDDSFLKKKYKSDGFSGLAEAISVSLKKLAKLPVFIKKHTVISLLQIKLSVSSDNAADTAVNYGKFCALIYPAVSHTVNLFKHKKLDVDIYPDFDKSETEADINIFFKIKLIFLLIALIKGIITGVSIMKLFSESKEEKEKETAQK